MQLTVRLCNTVGCFLMIKIFRLWLWYMPVHTVDASSVLMALQNSKLNGNVALPL